MKIKRYLESQQIPSNDEELADYISDIIEIYLDLRQVPYTDDYDIDPDSVKLASKEIVKELKKIGNLDIFYSSKKYNL
jgi:hypothetical protein